MNNKTIDLLERALEWLDDYGLRMAGSAGLADEIREHVKELAPTENNTKTR